ncbi:hypothetical protein DRQ21_05085 [Candidatus Fermentibacteria bacterium]|nr:MAG: hypothetical protein DRQ21_05085 [Candidatus Fermentibacteria bacterium]
MTILLVLLGFSISPADSARALVSIRSIPEAAVYYSQMAAAEDGEHMVEFAHILEASGRFSEAYRVYGLALGNSSSQSTSRWLINRRLGVSPLDTTLVITASVTNTGDAAAWNVQVIIPMPVSHPPFQTLTILSNDFTPSGGLLSARIPIIAPGQTVRLSVTVSITQQPGSMRPVTGQISDEALAWITHTLRSMNIPEALPGPCIPMSEEMARLAAGEIGLSMTVEGGLILDTGGCIFHAWDVINEYNIRIDPLLFKDDSLLSIAHNPADVVPLWDLSTTDGYELNLLFKDPACSLTGTMSATAIQALEE